VIPLRDENPTEMTPYVTGTLIAVNLAVWVLLQGAGSEPALEASVRAFGSIPCEVTGACPVRGLGASTVFTSMFMHGGWGHIIGNLLFLWVFGNNVEDSMGHLRFLVFYLLCGAAADLAHVYSAPASGIPTVGASGAISGVMGGYVLLYPRVRVETWFPPIFLFGLPAWVFLGYWFFLQLGTGLATSGTGAAGAGGVAVWAHVGGFVAGLVLIKFFENRTLTEAKRHKVKLPESEVARMEW
jgi:membrane associated rhomboid family serine protease